MELRDANAFVEALHRHSDPVIGHKFSLGAVKDGKIVGVAIVGRPVNRIRQDGWTLEITRLCTDGTKNACSYLYGACRRAVFALGYRRLGTYIRKSEDGTSLKAAGFRLVAEVKGRSWSCPSRPRVTKREPEDRTLWESAIEIPSRECVGKS